MPESTIVLKFKQYYLLHLLPVGFCIGIGTGFLYWALSSDLALIWAALLLASTATPFWVTGLVILLRMRNDVKLHESGVTVPRTWFARVVLRQRTYYPLTAVLAVYPVQESLSFDLTPSFLLKEGFVFQVGRGENQHNVNIITRIETEDGGVHDIQFRDGTDVTVERQKGWQFFFGLWRQLVRSGRDLVALDPREAMEELQEWVQRCRKRFHSLIGMGFVFLILFFVTVYVSPLAGFVGPVLVALMLGLIGVSVVSFLTAAWYHERGLKLSQHLNKAAFYSQQGVWRSRVRSLELLGPAVRSMRFDPDDNNTGYSLAYLYAGLGFIGVGVALLLWQLSATDALALMTKFVFFPLLMVMGSGMSYFAILDRKGDRRDLGTLDA